MDLSSLATEAVENIRPSVAAKGVTFDVRIEPGVWILGDRDRLRQIMWTPLTNAVKFTPMDGRIEMRVWPEQSRAIISVRDSGIGVSPGDLPHIFKRFWQAETKQTREHSGLGLGLALARHLAELHGGSIEASSAGEGRARSFG